VHSGRDTGKGAAEHDGGRRWHWRLQMTYRTQPRQRASGGTDPLAFNVRV
jgi:hypothetical protein